MGQKTPEQLRRQAEKRWRGFIDSVLNGSGSVGYLTCCEEGIQPMVLAALADPRAVPTREQPNPKPLKVLAEYLAEYPSAEAVRILVPYLRICTGEVLARVVTALMREGSPGTIPLLREVLKGDDAELKGVVVKWTMEEVWRKGRTFDTETNLSFASAFLEQLGVESKGYEQTAYLHAALLLDEDAALAFVEREGRLELNHPHAESTWRAIDRARIELPSGLAARYLDELVDEAEQAPGEAKEFVLLPTRWPVLARAMPEKIRSLADRVLNYPRRTLHKSFSGVTSAVAALENVEDASRVVSMQMQETDDEGNPRINVQRLSEEQLNHYAASEVDAQVFNGGFSQFFFNPSGAIARRAPAALLAIGAPRRAELVKQALACLTPEQLDFAETHYADVEQPDVIEALGNLDNAYNDLKGEEPVFDLLKLYAAANPSHFQRP